MRSRLIHYRLVLGLAAVAAALVHIPEMTETAEAQTGEVPYDLPSRVKAYEQVWNTHQAVAIAAFFTEDADMIFGNGLKIVGRKAIRDWWGGYFDRVDNKREGTFAIDSLRMITPDVALINIISTTAGRSSKGERLPTRLARGTWVMVRHSGEWWISALRGLPAMGDLRLSPGTDR